MGYLADRGGRDLNAISQTRGQGRFNAGNSLHSNLIRTGESVVKVKVLSSDKDVRRTSFIALLSLRKRASKFRSVYAI